jgi:hypothetical protein
MEPFAVAGLVFIVSSPLWLGIVVQLLHNRTKRKKQRKSAEEWERSKNVETRGQYRDRMTMEAALRNTQQNAPPAVPPSLSTRLAQLDAAMKAGQVTQQEYAKARAAILASP